VGDLVLSGDGLSLADAVRAAKSPQTRLRAGRAAMKRVRASRAVIDAALAEGRPVYGVNTGFGKLQGRAIAAGDLKRLQRNLVLSHACGVGEPFWYHVGPRASAFIDHELGESGLHFFGEAGVAYRFGNRDTDLPVPTWVGRAVRAHLNLLENLSVFAILVLVAHVSGHANATTALGATIFFWARVAHAATYIGGIIYARTGMFFIGLVGEIMILRQLF